MLERKAFLADVVYNGLGTPRSDAAVVTQDASDTLLVVAVEAIDEVRRRYPGIPEIVAGFAVSPAPVNAHTHVDLSAMPYHPGDYLAFIRAVLDHGRRGGRGLAAARQGVEETLAAGVSAVGDIVTDEEVAAFLLGHPRLTGVAYWEVIGPNPADADRILAETRERVRRLRALERPGGVRLGLSPHTPHTVSGTLLAGLARLATAERLPLQIHVAESVHEVAYHRHGSGPLLELMAGADPGLRPSQASPVGYLARLGVLEAAPSLVHMIHVTDEDVRLVQRAGCVVVHCPRSNEALGCGRFPWELYAKHGVTVAFGTDSRASSPSLSVVDEVAAARRVHGSRASPLGLVRAAVKGGHRALGLTPPKVLRGAAAASLTVWRDGVAVPLPDLAT